MRAGGKREKEPHNNNNLGFPPSSVGKASACNAGDLGSIPGRGRSPAEGNGNPLQYSCLENPTDRGVWQATVHGVTRAGHSLVTNPPPPTRTNRFHLLTLTSSVLSALFMPNDVVRWHHLRFTQGVLR